MDQFPSPQNINTSFEQLQSKLYQQTTTTQGKKTFRCLSPGCEKTYRYKSDMERHVITHSKEKTIACPYPSCNKSFKRPYALRYHIQTNHIESTLFSCPLGCHLKFRNRISLKYHVLKHEVIKMFALNSPEGQEISFPWKRVVQWERDWWNKHKPIFAEGVQEQLSPEDSENFEIELLSFLRGNSRSRSGSFWNNENFSCCSKEIADAFSVASFDQSESFNDQSFFESMYDQLIKENRDLKKNLSDKINSFNANAITNLDYGSWAAKLPKLDFDFSQVFQNQNIMNFKNIQE